MKGLIKFDVVNKETVEYLSQDKELDLLPKKKVNTKKEVAWDKKKIQNETLNAIRSGKSIDDISATWQNTLGMNKSSATMNCRTAITGAQNNGRLSAITRLENMGVNVYKQWLATGDSRTRDSHLDLNGEEVKPSSSFSNGCDYPGDPDGAPSEVYNCRCTMVTSLPDYDVDVAEELADEMGVNREIEIRKAQLGDKVNKKVVKEVKASKVKDISSIKVDEAFKKTEVMQDLVSRNVEYLEPQKAPYIRDDEEIIKRLAGGDKTGGSCVSLSFAYTGNKAGYDVLDFRGGESQDIFSTNANIQSLLRFDGRVNHKEIKAKDEIKACKQLMGEMEKGKEYILISGRHGAVIRKTDKGYQYLELQSSKQNGWKDFAGDRWTSKSPIDYTLSWRWRAQHRRTSYGYAFETVTSLTEVESLGKSDAFKSILGYINTDPSKQLKGITGSIK